MAKPAKTTTTPTNRKERAARAASKRSSADAPDPLDGINEKISRWKALFIQETRAKIEVGRVRDDVKESLLAAGVEFITHPTEGTIALQRRSGSTAVDWEGLARSLLEPSAVEAALPKFTRVGAPAVVLAALPGWSVEAKAGLKAAG